MEGVGLVLQYMPWPHFTHVVDANVRFVLTSTYAPRIIGSVGNTVGLPLGERRWVGMRPDGDSLGSTNNQEF